MYDTVNIRRSPLEQQRGVPPPIEIDGVPFRPHPAGGGLVAVTAHVGPHVYVDKCATIKGRAIVVGSVRLFGLAVIEDEAIVTDFCTLREQSSIGGRAVVRGGVQLEHNARIEGAAHVSGGVRLQYFAHVDRGSFTGRVTIT